MNLFTGKKGIVIGVANERSICWKIANELIEQGAKIAVSYIDATETRVKNLINQTSAITYKCDVSSDESLNNFFDFVKQKLNNIDFIVCAPAFTKKQNLSNEYKTISRDDFLETMNISVYSLTAVCNVFSPILNNNGSVLTVSYYGAEKIVPNYNVMGVAKAALESSVRYLSNDLGKRGIRVNSISSGAIKTIASSTIGDFNKILNYGKDSSPLKRNITAEEVAKTALFLLSDMSSGITAENIHVDCGLNAVGLFIANNN